MKELGENLLKASSAKEALELLLRNDVAVILVDVVMPDLDGFELAQMTREHPRFKDTAIIFISAINITELDSLKGYELGAVDYVCRWCLAYCAPRCESSSICTARRGNWRV